MVLPISLLRTTQNHPMLVELKNGETYNGHLVSCDNWMNVHLREVICTSRDGDKFWKMPEVYVRGATIKYLRIPDEVMELAKEESQSRQRNRGQDSRSGGNMRGAKAARGGGRGRGDSRGGQRGRGRGGSAPSNQKS